MRGALLSVSMAFAGVAGVIASGWALQAGALPPPKPAARVAADASVWFHEYRLALDVFHFDHRRVQGACLRGWLPGPDGGKERGSLLSFRAGPIVRISGTHVSIVAQRRRWSPPALLAAEVGCSRMLERALAAAAQGAGRLTMERSFAANRPAVALEARHGREGRLTFFVAPQTAQPLVAFADREGRKITARIYLQRISQGLLKRFGLLHRINPEPMR